MKKSVLLMLSFLLLTFFPKKDVCSQAFIKIFNDPCVNSTSQSYGSSFFDYDNDGDLDLYVANFTNNTNELFINNGSGVFTNSNVNIITTTSGSSLGHTWIDFDKDCDLDLFISNGGVNGSQTNRLYINNNGTYSIASTSIIPSTTFNSQTSNWGDFDNDGDLDLFVANLSNQNNLFLINNSGTFSLNNSSIISTDGGMSNDANWVDYDNDGDLDLFVANAVSNENYLYNNNNGVFTKIIIGSIVTDVESSIGSVWGDYNNDGFLDLYVCNNGTNSLYKNNGNGTFTKITTGNIVTDAMYSYGASWVDYNNDGYLDMFVTNTNGQDNNLYKNNGNGTFTKILTGSIVTDGGISRSNTWADIDGDGDLDCYVTNRGYSNNFLYKNNLSNSNWINIKLIGDSSNFDAIGCVVKAKATINGNQVWQMRHISSKVGYCSQESPNVEFGFGNATMIDSLLIYWPTIGSLCVFTNIPTNQFVTYYENCTSSNQIYLSDTICIGSDYNAYINGSVFDWFSDSLGNNLICNDSVLNFTNLQNDTSVYFSKSGSSCFSLINKFSIFVSNSASLSFSLGVDTFLCNGDSLIISLPYLSNQVAWQDGTLDSVYIINSSGQYIATVNLNGCIGKDTINIISALIPTQHSLIDTVFCEGGYYDIMLDSGFNYLWSDGTYVNQKTLDTEGLYYVQVYNQCDTIIDSVNVSIIKVPNQENNRVIQLCIGESYDYISDTAFNYLWSDGLTLGSRVFAKEGDFWIQISNQCDTVKNNISIRVVDCDCKIFIPNVFTPNDDGLNDKFWAVIKCDLKQYEMLIFNRWGELIFESTDQDEKWNGKYKGEDVPDGVYFYRMNFLQNNNDSKMDYKVGSITLFR